MPFVFEYNEQTYFDYRRPSTSAKNIKTVFYDEN